MKLLSWNDRNMSAILYNSSEDSFKSHAPSVAGSSTMTGQELSRVSTLALCILSSLLTEVVEGDDDDLLVPNPNHRVVEDESEDEEDEEED